jgi:catecholate siderophore receptor
VRPERAGHARQHAGAQGVDFSRWGVAPSLAVGLNGDTQLTLSYYHLDTDQTPDYGIPLADQDDRTAHGPRVS